MYEYVERQRRENPDQDLLAKTPRIDEYHHVSTVVYDSTQAVHKYAVMFKTPDGMFVATKRFAAVNVVAGDTITFDYTLTLVDGKTSDPAVQRLVE